MTKALAWLAVPLLTLLAVPAGLAHGAAEPREIDTRVLLDDDGLPGYGGCSAFFLGGCPAQGLDFVVLEMREAYLDGEPALVMRLVFQTDHELAGRGIQVSFVANGIGHAFSIASPDAAPTSSDFDAVQGPFDAFDGHPKAVDAWVKHATFGIGVGDEVTGITVATTQGESADDIAPGTWMTDAGEAPFVPSDPTHLADDHPEASYVVRGPATLITLAGEDDLVDVAEAGTTSLRLANPLATFSQGVTLSLLADEGVLATLDLDNATLDPSATRTVSLDVDPASASGNLTVVAESDLGGRAVHTLQVVGKLAAAPGNDTDGHDHDEHEHKDEEAPAPAALLLAPLALAIVAWRRRHA